MQNIELTKEKIHLTKSEIMILFEVMSGLNNNAIAKKLEISPHTVKFHLQSLLIKTCTHTRTELCSKVLFAILGKPLTPELIMQKFN